MGGSNGMFEPGNVNVAAPYFISGRSGLLPLGLVATNPVARLAQLGMIDPRLANGALQATPIRISQIRMHLSPRTAPANGAIFEIFKGVGTPATVDVNGALAHLPQRRKTTGYPAITVAETVLAMSGIAALTGGAFTPTEAAAPLDWVSVGVGDVSAGRSVWTPSDLCPLQLEAGEALEVRLAADFVSGTYIFGLAIDFLR